MCIYTDVATLRRCFAAYAKYAKKFYVVKI